ncbi:MAG: histidine--tRNA ligase [Sphingosinicella sp.]
MSRRPQRVRGTQDIFGEDAARFRAVTAAFERVRRLFAFQPVETPVFEETAVFARSIGEATDIVSKEMYSFEDRGGESLTLRPEFTAGICRAYISEGWQQHAPLKLAAFGPVFRYERPQKGRYRQFHQLDVEIIGSDSPVADVEVIAFGAQLLAELGISQSCQLQLNTLGDEATREAWRSALVEHFRGQANLSEDSRRRLERNPLRILDSREPQDRPAIDSAPAVDDFLTAEAGDFFGKVTAGLDAAGIGWTRNPRLVRGIDYYRHTAFEFLGEGLGSQNAVIAGGRYDGLVGELGGPPTPAIGWAAGIERLGMMIDAPAAEKLDVAVVDDDARSAERVLAYPIKIATIVRNQGRSCTIVGSGKRSKRYDRATILEPRLVFLLQNRDFTGLHLRVLKEKPDGGYVDVDELAESQLDVRLSTRIDRWLSTTS